MCVRQVKQIVYLGHVYSVWFIIHENVYVLMTMKKKLNVWLVVMKDSA